MYEIEIMILFAQTAGSSQHLAMAAAEEEAATLSVALAEAVLAETPPLLRRCFNGWYVVYWRARRLSVPISGRVRVPKRPSSR